MTAEQFVSAALENLEHGCVIHRSAHTQNLRWANSALTTNGDTQTSNLTVIAFDHGRDGIRVGIRSSEVGEPGDAAVLARGSVEDARGAPVSESAPLTDGGRSDDFASDPQALDPRTTDRLLEAAGTFLEMPGRQFGYAELGTTTTYLATTAGTRRRQVQDEVRFEASVRDEGGSTWWGTNTLATDFDAAARAEQDRLEWQHVREDLEPGRYPVILSPSAVADLLIYLAWSANGRDAAEGHNVFARAGGGTRLGEQLTRRAMTLSADPQYPGLATSDRVVVDSNSSMESVFDNGLPLRRRSLIEDGRLVSLRASRPTAARFGLEPVYLADNLILTDNAGDGDLTDLLARTHNGVLVNCLWYIREVDPQNLLLTGLTRDGVYRVRDGEVVAALPNFRFNVAVPDLLDRVVDATKTSACLPREWADWFTRTAMPALSVDGFNLSSRSDAV